MKNIFSFYIYIMLYAMFMAPAAGAESEIKFPPARVTVNEKWIRVIGMADSEGDVSLRVANSGGAAMHIPQVRDNIFQLQAELWEGTNTIELLDRNGLVLDERKVFYATINTIEKIPDDFNRIFLHPKDDLLRNCRDCHLVKWRGEPDFRHIDGKMNCITEACHKNAWQKKFTHGPIKEGNCIGCHNPHGTVYKNFLVGLRDELCNECHDTMEEITPLMTVHFPVAKGECLSCHEPHASNLEFHLKRNSQRDLCAACHGYSYTDHEFMHDPVESEDCIACHAPHISPYKGLLYEKGNNMCFTCHEVRHDEFARKHVHKPVKEDCNLCHDPHGSAAVYHLKTRRKENGRYTKVDKPQQEACFLCHRKLDPEVVDMVENAPVKHKPVVDGKCTVCHTPHSTNFPKQLRHATKENCFACHKELQTLITQSEYKHGPVRANDCVECHTVHGGRYPRLLKAGYSTELYCDFDIKQYTMCFNCHNARVVLEERTHDTGFRNGSYNLHYEHVNRKKKGRNCIACHEIHASDQAKHIRRKIPYKKRLILSLDYTKTDTGGGCVVGCHRPRQYDRENPVKYKREQR